MGSKYPLFLSEGRLFGRIKSAVSEGGGGPGRGRGTADHRRDLGDCPGGGGGAGGAAAGVQSGRVGDHSRAVFDRLDEISDRPATGRAGFDGRMSPQYISTYDQYLRGW